MGKKEKDRLGVEIKIYDRIIEEDEKIQMFGEVSGCRFHNSRRCELEYVIKSTLRKRERKKTLKFYWGQREEVVFLLSRRIPSCDFYKIRFSCLKWKDLTGICSLKKELDFEEHFLVMPKKYPLETMRDKIQRQVLKQQGFEYDGIREYRSGDRLSKIHWKIFAGKGQLYVRKGEEEQAEPVTMFLDVSSLKRKQYSDYFSILYSLSSFFLEEGIPQRIYFGRSSILLDSMEQYEELFTLIFQENLSIVPEIENEKAICIPVNPSGVSVQHYLFDLELSSWKI